MAGAQAVVVGAVDFPAVAGPSVAVALQGVGNMAFLSKTEKQQISEAIRKAEAKTSGELVTVIARSSDDYLYIPLLWASIIALFVPGLMFLLVSALDFSTLYAVQVVTFLILASLFQWTPLKMKLIPMGVKQQRANRMAHEQFYRNGLHLTQDNTGVLLFVSVAEHYVQIIADRGINEKVPPGAWDAIVANFIRHIKQKKIAEGFLGAVDSCGELLAQHAPVVGDNKNELPNVLIEI